MNYITLSSLIQAVQQSPHYEHQIKGKRVRKQLQNLKEYKNEAITLKRYTLSNAGVSIFIETQHNFKIYEFQLLLDYEYPFNPPQLYYIHESSPYAYCQDLLQNVLEGNWGPSMLLSLYLDKISTVGKKIHEESPDLKCKYHPKELYCKDLLKKYKVQLFDMEEYQWKFMIKSTKKIVFGLSKEHMLKFTPQSEQMLKLEDYSRINSLSEANANITDDKAGKKLYLGGKEEDIERILYLMNPIEVIERQLAKKQKDGSEANEQVLEIIKKYSELIQYYSLRNPQKSQKYVQKVQQLISKRYEQPTEKMMKEEEIKKEIQT